MAAYIWIQRYITACEWMKESSICKCCWTRASCTSSIYIIFGVIREAWSLASLVRAAVVMWTNSQSFSVFSTEWRVRHESHQLIAVYAYNSVCISGYGWQVTSQASYSVIFLIIIQASSHFFSSPLHCQHQHQRVLARSQGVCLYKGPHSTIHLLLSGKS